MPTQAVFPQASPASQPNPQPQSQPPTPNHVTASSTKGGEWKKAVMTGGIIGLSILTGAVVLKTQGNSSPTANSTQTPAIVATPSPTTTTSNPETRPEPAAPKPVAPAAPQLSPAEAAKAEAGTDATIVGEPGSKNIRSGPGTQYDSPHTAYPGDRVKVTATSRDEGGYVWNKVYFPKSGAEGWVAAQLVRMDSGSTPPQESKPTPSKPAPSKPPVDEPEAAPPEASPEDQANATIVGEAGSKNVRSGPGTNYDSPHMAYPGDRVQIMDTQQDKGGFTWYKVYFPKSGAEGWIAAQLVKPDAR